MAIPALRRQVTRRAFLTGAAAGAAVALAACGGAPPATSPSSATSPTAASPPTSAPSPTTAPALQPTATISTSGTKQPAVSATPTANPQPTAIPVSQPVWSAPKLDGKSYTMWGLNFAPHVDKYREIADAFEKKTGAKGKIEPQSGALTTKLLAAISAGVAPDIECLMGKSCAPLIRANALLPFNDAVFKAVSVDPEKWFTPGAIQAYRYSGKYYGVPVEDSTVASFIISRLDWIKAAGVQGQWPPLRGGTSWFADYDEMWALAKALQKQDSAGKVSVWGYNSAGWDLQQFGGICRMLQHNWFDPETKTFKMGADLAQDAIQYQVGKAVELGIETELGSSGQNLFAQGKVAVARGNMGIFPEADKNQIPVDGCIAPPLKKGSTPLFMGEGGWGFIIPANAKNRDVAVQLAQFLTTYDGNKIFMSIYGGDMPPIYAEEQDPFFVDAKEHSTQVVRSWFPAQKLTVYYPEGLGDVTAYEAAYQQAASGIRSGKLSVKDASNQLQGQFTEILTKWTSSA